MKQPIEGLSIYPDETVSAVTRRAAAASANDREKRSVPLDVAQQLIGQNSPI